MVFTSSRRIKGRNISYISKNSRCDTVNSHVNSSESNNLNASKNDNVIVNSKLPHINVHTKSSFNTLITLQSEIDT